MNHWISTAHRGLSRLADAFGYLAMITMAVMAVHVFLSVANRWFTGREIAGTLEVTTYYYMVGLVFLPMAFVEYAGGHIRADLLTRFTTQRVQNVIEGASQFVMAVFFAVLAWKLFENAIERTARGELVQTGAGLFATWPSRWFPAVGLTLASLYALSTAACIARGIPVGTAPAAAEAAEV